MFSIPGGDEGKTIVRHIKIAFYLDPLTATAGALRVIPGSHHLGDTYAQGITACLPNGSTDLSEDGTTEGVSSDDVPAMALPVVPGDVLIFDHRIMHASFGGSSARRMFAMNLCEPCHTTRQKELTAELFRMYGTGGCHISSAITSPEMRPLSGSVASSQRFSSNPHERRATPSFVGREWWSVYPTR